MASPHLVDPIRDIDPVDALRLLVADLQALADRLGLTEQSRSLQHTMRATQERVFGPRAVVMLLGDQAAVKRSFLERLLGPQLAAVPHPRAGCMRLEHGDEAECTVTLPQGMTAVMPLEQLPSFLARRGMEMPQHSMQTVRLPNAALGRGLAVIDTPALSDAEPGPWLLEAAEQSDAWLLVLSADHALSQNSIAALRRLPRPANRLDIVVEGAESLTGEARQQAREQLLRTLREQCDLAEARLTLLAFPEFEGHAGSFWHGRFATFQSVTMQRGRERWVAASRSIVAEALDEVAAEIEFELKGAAAGVRQGRLRLGQKDLAVLHTRFDELGLLQGLRPRETPALVSAVIWPETGDSAVKTAPEAVLAHRDAPTGATMAVAPERGQQIRNAAAMDAATQVKLHADDAELEHAPGSAPSVLAMIALLIGPEISLRPPTAWRERRGPLLWTVGGGALAVAAVAMILWGMWPREHAYPQEPAAQWNPGESGAVMADSATAASKSQAGASRGSEQHRRRGGREVIADPTFTDLGLGRARAIKPSAAIPREPVATEVATAAPAPAATLAADKGTGNVEAAAASSRKHHRGFLGLGRAWRWVRHDNDGAAHVDGVAHSAVDHSVVTHTDSSPAGDRTNLE